MRHQEAFTLYETYVVYMHVRWIAANTIRVEQLVHLDAWQIPYAAYTVIASWWWIVTLFETCRR